MSLPEHQRKLPHFEISEQGLRELEIWLLARLRAAAGGDGWRFNIQNTGGFGYVRFNDAFDLDTFPRPDSPLANGGSWGGVFEDDSGQGLMIGSTTLVEILSKIDVIVAADSGLALSAFNDDLTLSIGPGKKLTVFNQSGDRILEMTDGSLDLHIPAGGNVIADLT